MRLEAPCVDPLFLGLSLMLIAIAVFTSRAFMVAFLQSSWAFSTVDMRVLDLVG